MPRGVYDRSKTKEQRAAEKATGKSPKAKAKKTHYGKKPLKSYMGQDSGSAFPETELSDSKQRLEILEKYFEVLVNSKSHFQDSNKLGKAIENTLEKMESLSARIYPGMISEDIKTTEAADYVQPAKKNGAKHAAVTAPPAPTAATPAAAFNPTAPNT